MSATEFYVANSNANSILVCNYEKVVQSIPVGKFPRCVAFTPDGNLSFVTNSKSGTVSVIDANKRTVVHTISIEQPPLGAAVTPDGKYLYVTVDTPAAGYTLVYAVTSYKRVAKIKVGQQPGWVATSRNEKAGVCVANFKSKSVSLIDIGTQTVAATIPVCDGPTGVALSPKGEKAYVPCPNLGCWNLFGDLAWHMPVIDTAKKQVVNYVLLDTQPTEVAIGKKTAYITATSYIDAVETLTDQVSGSILGPGKVPWLACVALNDNDARCVVTDPPAALISIIDVDNLTVGNSLKLNPGPDRPFGVAFRP